MIRLWGKQCVKIAGREPIEGFQAVEANIKRHQRVGSVKDQGRKGQNVDLVASTKIQKVIRKKMTMYPNSFRSSKRSIQGK